MCSTMSMRMIMLAFLIAMVIMCMDITMFMVMRITMTLAMRVAVVMSMFVAMRVGMCMIMSLAPLLGRLVGFAPDESVTRLLDLQQFLMGMNKGTVREVTIVMKWARG